MYNTITKCRICRSEELIAVVALGQQYLTGVFPRKREDEITKGPLELVYCKSCGLLQLKHSYAIEEMYGENYGYRSGLNRSMVKHLQNKIQFLERMAKPGSDDVVIDIGSNDATSLKAYQGPFRKVGIDPTGKKFQKYYSEGIDLIPDFFSAQLFHDKFPGRKAKIVTSIAMFYDLEDPVDFVRNIYSVLDDEGIWHFEQSYMPSMLRTNSYDTICHEHLEFYSLGVIRDMLNRCDMKILDVQMNAVNGGSFAVTASKKSASYRPNHAVIQWLIDQELDMGLNSLKPYRDFEDRVYKHRKNLKDLIEALVSDGKKVLGYGASTKGNVLLQFCDLTERHIPFIADINEDKFGAFTPGTGIPIISEEEAKAMKPDYFLVLPWHFKNNILEREKDYLDAGGKFIFPLPEIEIMHY
ncbi:MAG: class I SAM-dependent methyltransferase [Leptospiraceae bacterium]